MSYNSPQPAREKRASARVPVELPVLIESSGSQHNAKVHNLSRGGALVEVTGQMPSGSHIRFNCGSIETSGTVVWKDDSCLGVKFATILGEERISQQVARSEAAARHRELFKRPV